MAHTREGSFPRMPFQTPAIHHTAYREPAQTTPKPAAPQPSSATASSKPQVPTLNVITGFDNPRTPPAPGRGFDTGTKHSRNTSVQDRRAAKVTAAKVGSLGVNQPPITDLSPSDGTVLIGFEQALQRLNIQTSAKKLNIQHRHENIVSPITPSIIVTGVPKDGQDMDDMFLKPVDPRHRSSVYSQATNIRQLQADGKNSAGSTPPVPAIPHSILGAGITVHPNAQNSRVTSWNTDFDEEEENSVTYVGSVHPVKDDMEVKLLERSNTGATTRSQGWWNTITTPFLLQRTATLDKRFPRSPGSQSSSRPSPQSSPQPSSMSGSGHALSEANVAALTREVDTPALPPTTPHLADEKRQTIGFFGDATPKTATFPPVPPLPHAHQEKLIMSPEFVDAGAFGQAAEYYEACWHDMTSEEPFFECVNHDCKKWRNKDAIADARSRELFLASAAVDRANQALDVRGNQKTLSVHTAQSVHKDLPALPTATPPQPQHSSPALTDHVQPSDSVSQVAERRAEAEAVASRARGLPETPQHSEHRQTIFSDGIGSPEVAEATAMPIIRATTPEPMHVNERKSVSETTPRPRAAPVMLSHVAAPGPGPGSSAPRETQAPMPAPMQASVPASVAPPAPASINRAPPVPYPDSDVGVPLSEYVPPPPPPPPALAPYPESTRMPVAAPSMAPETSREVGAYEPTAVRSFSPAAASQFAPPPTMSHAIDHQANIGTARSMPQPYDGATSVHQVSRGVAQVEHPGARSMSPATPAKADFQSPAADAGPSRQEIGIARSIQFQAPKHSDESSRHHRAPSVISEGSSAARPPPTVVSSRNPFKRQMPPPLSVHHSPQPQDAVSPGAVTPNMARDAEIGNAVPLQPTSQAGISRNAGTSSDSNERELQPARTNTFTRRAVMERYDQRRSSPQPTLGNQPHTPLPPPVLMTGPDHDVEASRDVTTEKGAADLPPRPPKKQGYFAKLLAHYRAEKKRRPVKTKEQKKKRRCCCLIFFALFAMVLLIVLLVMLLTVKHASIPAQSSWLNLTNYPPIPTGVATIARPNAVLEQSGCVQPQTMWSCAVPREQQDGIKPNNPDQPNFRMEILFQNGTSMSNGTTVTGNTSTAALSQRDAANMWNPSPAPPSEDDQIFLGNTSDLNMAPYDGEQTPFFITFLPVTINSDSSLKHKRDLSSDSSASSVASSSSLTPTATSSSPSSTNTDFFPDLLSAIPSPSLNPDGSAISPSLYPLPSSQPLRLYNRNQPSEHYGFYTYFDRSIFLTSATLPNSSLSASLSDIPGGATASSALKICTWSQTRFLVQIWTGGPNGTGNQARQLLNGSSTAEAAAAGNITAHSESTFTQPGSFPYPVTITVDRHGGAAKEKMIYCYGIENGKVNVTDKKISLEDRGYAGTLIHSSGGFLTNVSASDINAPIDGGTGGCGCSWQNFQNV